MDISISIKVGSDEHQVEYQVWETRAPRAYDYAGVIQIQEGHIRVVAIPKSDVTVQCARYASGMYGMAPCESGLFDEGLVLDRLFSRLIYNGKE